jgi:hypothetical protein
MTPMAEVKPMNSRPSPSPYTICEPSQNALLNPSSKCTDETSSIP